MKYHLASLILFTSISAAAGPISSGGGNAVVCRNDIGAITSAEVLDLYEGRVEAGITPLATKDPMRTQADSAMARLLKGREKSFANLALGNEKYVAEKMRILPDGTGLIPIDDSFHVIVPKSCKIEQLANYMQDDQVLIDGEIWAALDDTNKAALIVHEALYKTFRIFGARNSVRVRKAVARAFSGVEGQDFMAGVPENSLLCFTTASTVFPATTFRAFNDPSGKLVFRFERLDGETMLTKSEITLGDEPIPAEMLAHNYPDSSAPLRRSFGTWIDSEFDSHLKVEVLLNTREPSEHDNKTIKIGLGDVNDANLTEFACAYPHLPGEGK